MLRHLVGAIQFGSQRLLFIDCDPRIPVGAKLQL
jgi:hypothetical protein